MPPKTSVWNNAGNTLYLIGGKQLWSCSLPSGALHQLTHVSDTEIQEILGASNGRFAKNDVNQIVVRTFDPRVEESGFSLMNLHSGEIRRSWQEPKG